MNEKEKAVVSKMIGIYCRFKHENSKVLCESCNELKEYALSRLEKCPYGDDKPTCNSCTVHCYRKDMKIRIKEVMRFSGPRMMLYHPIDTIEHFYKEYRRKRLFIESLQKKMTCRT